MFANCYNLKSITIPSAVTEIPCGLFQNCIGLVEVVLYDGIASIYDDAFLGCSSLKELFIPDSVTYIQGSVFQGCSSLKTISFHENLTIGKYGFYNCTSLESFTFPVTAKSISAFLFSTLLTHKPNPARSVVTHGILNATASNGVYPHGS